MTLLSVFLSLWSDVPCMKTAVLPHFQIVQLWMLTDHRLPIQSVRLVAQVWDWPTIFLDQI